LVYLFICLVIFLLRKLSDVDVYRKYLQSTANQNEEKQPGSSNKCAGTFFSADILGHTTGDESSPSTNMSRARYYSPAGGHKCPHDP